jgi:hypothetical protein
MPELAPGALRYNRPVPAGSHATLVLLEAASCGYLHPVRTSTAQGLTTPGVMSPGGTYRSTRLIRRFKYRLLTYSTILRWCINCQRYVRSNHQTLCNSIHLVKSIGTQLAKRFPAFYGVLMFVTVFTTACHRSLS